MTDHLWHIEEVLLVKADIAAAEGITLTGLVRIIKAVQVHVLPVLEIHLQKDLPTVEAVITVAINPITEVILP